MDPSRGLGERASTLTDSQLLFWFSQKVNPEAQLYYDRVTVLLRVRGKLEVSAFEAALADVVRGCAALRTRLREVDGIPVREVLDDVKLTLEHHDFSSAADPESLLAREAARLGSLPLGTGEPALFLARLAEAQFAFCLSQHHLLTDAWSTKLIVEQVSACYQAVLGRGVSPPPLSGFEGFLAHTASYRNSPAYARSRQYWQDKLAEPSESLRFYRGSPGASATATFRISLELGRERSEALARSAAEAGFFSPAVYFQTALFAYLARVSGQASLRMGVPFANRSSQFQTACGLLMNPCAMQVQVEDTETFASLARKVQREYIETGRHSLFPVRNPATGKVYEVYFNYQNVNYTSFAGFPAGFQLLHSGNSTDVLGLQVHDFNANGVFHLDFDFALRHFEPADATAATGHYLNLLDAFLADHRTSIGDARMLSANELKQVVNDFNRTQRHYGRAWLDEVIRRRATATPDAVAVLCADSQLTYEELQNRATRLASRLHRAGVGAGSLVGVLAERSLEMVVGLLGILNAGAAYVPIEPSYPDERIRLLLEECGPMPVLVQDDLRDRKALQGCVLIGLQEEPALEPWQGVTPGERTQADPAYVIFTSGSTGKPKGVVNTHAGICNRLFWMQEAYRLLPSDRVLQKTPFSFDVSVWEFFWPLLAGATLVVLPPEKHKDARYLARFIRDHTITVLHFVPSMLSAFLDAADASACSSIKRVISSGEALTPELAAKFGQTFRGATLHNLYGPTEAAIDVSSYDCPRDQGLEFVPIGKPIANMRLQILDRHRNPLPRGIVGEIHIGGVGLAKEYLGQPELTRERFVSVSPSLDPHGRLYKTGDLGRFGADGNIEYLGRTDYQIKLRGFRVELGEVEAACRRFPGVNEAVVDLREPDRGGGYLAAYVVRQRNSALDTSELREFLESELPEYMVPALIAELAALPLSRSGKVDRRALPRRSDLPSAAPLGPELVLDPVELRLTEIWKSQLQLERVGPTENFFELGGHSLMALEIIAQIQRDFRCEVPLAQFFQRKATIENLARAVRALA